MAKRFAYFKHKEDYDVEIEKRNAIDKDSIVFLEDTNSIANDSEIYEGVIWNKLIDWDDSNLPSVEIKTYHPAGMRRKIANNTNFVDVMVNNGGDNYIVYADGVYSTGTDIEAKFLLSSDTIHYSTFEDCNIKEVTFNNVKQIDSWAFSNNKLTSIDLGSLKKIGEFAFNENNISELNISYVEDLAPTAFFYNPLEIVKKTKNNWRFTITGNVISSTITNKVVLGTINPDLSKLGPAFHIIDEYAFSTLPITNIVIPSNIDTLSVNSFSNCKSLKSVELPNNITTIPVKCFMNNYSLSEINLENVTIIGDSAFQMSIALSECNLNNIENIGKFAFASSTMRKVTIGRNISFIQSYAFNCGRLNDITCLATICPSTSSSAFTGTPETGVLKVPTGSDYSSWLEQLGSGWTIEYI